MIVRVIVIILILLSGIRNGSCYAVGVMSKTGTMALDYRPHTFAEVVGQAHIKLILRAMVLKENPPPAIIFSGSRGTGKTTTARVLAAALNCEQAKDLKGDSCGVCASCVSVQTSSSLTVLEIDAASNTGVEDIARIREICAYATDGKWRVVLLDEAHSLSRQAFNALLKTLEEPPPQTVFVLLTTEVDKVIGTVRSRAMNFDFRRISVADIIGQLTTIMLSQNTSADGPIVQQDLLVEIANRAEGSMRDAIMLLDQVSRVGIKDVAGFHEMFGIKEIAIPLFVAALESNHVEGCKLIEDYFYRIGDATGLVSDLVVLVRDLIIIRSGGAVSFTPEKFHELQSIAGRLDIARLVSVIRVLWDLKAKTKTADNDQRAAMEMAFVLISEALAPSARHASTPILSTDAQPAKLGIADLQALASKGVSHG
jgi:DNA polymerase III subunit gamma/tau